MLAVTARAPTHRRRRERLSAPVRNLHRAGNPGARSTRARSRNLVAAPSDRARRSSHEPADQGAGALPAGISLRGADAGAARRALRRLRQPGFAQTHADVLARSANATSRPTASADWARLSSWRASWPADVRHIHVHYLHTPASVVRYAALLTGRTWTLFGPRKGHLDDAGLGEAREDGRSALGRHLHGAGRGASASRSARAPTMCRSSITVSTCRAFPRRRIAVRCGTAPIRPIPFASSRSGAPWRRKVLAICCGLSPPCRRICTGASPMWAAATSEQPKTQAAESGHWPNRVAFLGAKAQPDIIALLREADLFVAAVEESSFRRSGRSAQRYDGSRRPETCDRGDRFRRHPRIHSRRDRAASWCRRANGKPCRTPSIFWRATRSGALRWRCRLRAAAAGFFHGGRHRPARGALSRAASSRPQRSGCPRERRTTGCILCSAEKPGSSLPVGRPNHGAASAEGSRRRRVSRPNSQAELRTHRHEAAIGASGARAAAIPSPRPIALIAHYRGLAGRPAPGSVVHLPCLLQGAGLDRSARRRRARHPLCDCRRIARAEARRGCLVRGAPGRRSRPSTAPTCVFTMTEKDRPALEAARPVLQRLVDLPPFLDETEWARPAPARTPHRSGAAPADGGDDATGRQAANPIVFSRRRSRRCGTCHGRSISSATAKRAAKSRPCSPRWRSRVRYHGPCDGERLRERL